SARTPPTRLQTDNQLSKSPVQPTYKTPPPCRKAGAFGVSGSGCGSEGQAHPQGGQAKAQRRAGQHIGRGVHPRQHPGGTQRQGQRPQQGGRRRADRQRGRGNGPGAEGMAGGETAAQCIFGQQRHKTGLLVGAGPVQGGPQGAAPQEHRPRRQQGPGQQLQRPPAGSQPRQQDGISPRPGQRQPAVGQPQGFQRRRPGGKPAVDLGVLGRAHGRASFPGQKQVSRYFSTSKGSGTASLRR